MKTIIEMAIEAGVPCNSNWAEQYLEAFAALVLANTDPPSFMLWQEGNEAGRLSEREACAEVCDGLAESFEQERDFGPSAGAEHCADAIRARGTHD